MTLLTIDSVSLAFGGVDVFRNASARLEREGRVGLVGPNGVGKTSLLRVISGLAEPASGAVHITWDTRIGYLRQEAMEAFGKQTNTLYEEMLGVFSNVHAMEAEMRDLEERMATDPAAIEAYGDVLEKFEAIGGYDYDVRIAQTLAGLGFQETHYDLPLTHLSGGQKTRALLARLLLERPDLLILDEPTNHLDIEAIRWLEGTLRQWPGALLIVSHDRYFLDVVANKIWELTRTGIESYEGNYSAYLRQREERIVLMEKTYAQVKERLAQELDFIKRNIARASTSDMAFGKLRLLSRDLMAIQEVGLMAYTQSNSWLKLGVGSVRPLTVSEAEQALKRLENPVKRQPHLKMEIRSAMLGGLNVLKTRSLCVGYPDKALFMADDINLIRGECAAIIGGNGAGKTTFLRTLLGELSPLDGNVELGKGVKIGYFAQMHMMLNRENTVMDELIRHKEMPLSAARNLLARYLFRSEDVFKPVGALSGGEQARLALAILAQQGANLLVMDEPTNHLDIASQEALQEVLEAFEGTILLVTHDRYLVDRLATQVWTLEDGHLNVFKGTYRELLAAERVRV